MFEINQFVNNRGEQTHPSLKEIYTRLIQLDMISLETESLISKSRRAFQQQIKQQQYMQVKGLYKEKD